MADQNKMVSDLSPIDLGLLAWAEYWYPLAWKGLLFAAVLTAVGACSGIVFLLLQWRTSEVLEQQSNWRTSALEVQAKRAEADFERAKADIAGADARAAEANARAAVAEKGAADANLELARLKTPRSLKGDQQDKIIRKLKPFTGTQFDTALVTGDPEPSVFLVVVERILQQAGWSQIDWKGGDILFTREGKPVAGMTSANNVIVAIFPEQIAKLEPAALTLVAALNAEGIPAQLQNATGIVNTNRDAIHILMGRKT